MRKPNTPAPTKFSLPPSGSKMSIDAEPRYPRCRSAHCPRVSANPYNMLPRGKLSYLHELIAFGRGKLPRSRPTAPRLCWFSPVAGVILLLDPPGTRRTAPVRYCSIREMVDLPVPASPYDHESWP